MSQLILRNLCYLFEYYLSLLKKSNLIIGNSSSGIIEAPIFGIPTINVGNRQNKRSKLKTINNVDFIEKKLLKLIDRFFIKKIKYPIQQEFGKGKSFELFNDALNLKYFWKIDVQKTFKEIN